MRNFLLIAAVAATLTAGVAPQAMAQDHRGDWRDHDIHRFHDHDFARWRGGRWIHGRHGGRAGWWWVVGPTWYFYPQPVYPYPDPYQPPAVAPPPPQQYYYCDNPPGYYPYVPSCAAPWRAVPAG
jgi:hypothetical protein